MFRRSLWTRAEVLLCRQRLGSEHVAGPVAYRRGFERSIQPILRTGSGSRGSGGRLTGRGGTGFGGGLRCRRCARRWGNSMGLGFRPRRGFKSLGRYPGQFRLVRSQRFPMFGKSRAARLSKQILKLLPGQFCRRSYRPLLLGNAEFF